MEKQLIEVKLADLKPYKNNPRNNGKAVDKVKESIKQCGYLNPIVVDENMVILAGHTRYESLKKLGKEKEKVLIVSGLDEEQKKKYRLYDNKASELSEWDKDKLRWELEGIDFEGIDIKWGIENKHKYKCQYCGCEFD